MDVHYQLIFVTRLLKWLQWVFVHVLFRVSFVSRMAVSPRFCAGKFFKILKKNPQFIQLIIIRITPCKPRDDHRPRKTKFIQLSNLLLFLIKTARINSSKQNWDEQNLFKILRFFPEIGDFYGSKFFSRLFGGLFVILEIFETRTWN